MKKIILAAVAAALVLPVAVPSAEAKGRHDRGHDRWESGQYYGRDGRYREPKRLGRDDHVWRGRDNRYYCKRDNGTTGLIVGGVGGALLGRTIAGNGDKTLGTLLGGAGGALLGRSIDKGDVKCR